MVALLTTRPVTRGAQGGRSPLQKVFRPPGKMCWTSFKTIGRSSKNLGPYLKTPRPSWCPKLVKGLLITSIFRNDCS